MKKIKKIITNPGLVILYLMDKNFFWFLPDKYYIKLRYRLVLKKKLNIKKPTTYNEKLQWLKLYDRNDLYTIMVDKYEAKTYVKKIIGEEHIIPNIGVFDRFEDIDFDKLPNKFVIKCTHDSGGLIICKDKSTLDITSAKKKINSHLKRNYYRTHREWPYKNVKPRIIIEKYMEDDINTSMRDYKFFCFNGEPKIMYISEGLENHKTARMSFFDMKFNLIDCKRKDYRLLDYMPDKPKTFNKMVEYAKKLSRNVPHLRVDFYEINGKLYFGELTFFTCSGMIPFENEKWDLILGNYINLSSLNNKKNI